MNDASGRYQHHTDSPEDLRWDNPGWYVLRGLRRALATHVASLRLEPGARVLDYGCALQPYRSLLPPDVDYWGADLPGNSLARMHIDAAGRLPAETGSFDLVVSTQVLEHVVDPPTYLREALRVLKKDGHLLLSTHGLWRYHPDPLDYWRWTGPGLRHEVGRAGFEVEHFEGVLGLAGVAVQTLQDATYYKVPARLRRWYAAGLQRVAGWFDRLEDVESRRRDAMVFVLLARRP